MSSPLRNVPDSRIIADGAAATIVRAALIASAIAILAIGLLQLPSIVTTHGEMVVGLVLSLLVGLQIFFAAVRFPLGSD